MLTVGPQLDYAPGAPIRRRRVRRVMGLLLGAGLLFAAWWFHAPVWEHAKLLYDQRQCMNYTAPPEQVVYDENNGTVSPLIGSAGYQGVPAGVHYASRALPMFPPTVAVRPAPELGTYLATMDQPLAPPPATVFLHELRTKSGLVRLVAVLRWPIDTGHILHKFGLEPVVINPAGFTSRPVVHWPPPVLWSQVPAHNPADTQDLRFYAGQPDPADAAHFTIKYDLRNGSGIIDGRLNEDGQTVSLKILSGPALGTSWAIDRVAH